MKGKSQPLWTEAGYQLVSEQGFKQINIESIARSLGKNKSSFYHYFGDWEGYEEALMAHHLLRAEQFAEDVHRCESILPGLIELFVQYQTDLFFHKQLRINRDQAHYKHCFERVHQLFEQAFLKQWAKFIRLEDRPDLAAKFLRLISENFLLQITPEHYQLDWLSAYLQDVASLMLGMNAQGSN